MDKIVKEQNSITVIDLLSKLTLEIDLLAIWTAGQIKLQQELMTLNKNSRNKKVMIRYTNAKIHKARLESFENKLLTLKTELMENIKTVLAKYDDTYLAVFDLYFLKKKTKEEISKELNLSFFAITEIIARFEKDIISLYKYD